MRGYRVAVFGDNHLPFLCTDDETTVLNCGGFLRRNSDQHDHQPKVGVIWSDGGVTRVDIDVSKDVTLQVPNLQPTLSGVNAVTGSLDRFMDELSGLETAYVDFIEALKAYMTNNRTGDEVRQAVMKAAEGKK